MKKFLFIFLASVALNARAQKPILVTADWLKEHLHDPGLVLIQVSFMKYELTKST
jgi:3-mercaptopyruvate sulfurtransferase SseA